ncbi:efflux RND transporter periplasmic adaptor subunit [Terriglobus tenax]|uniref:efflux RND transporter periplasmic adaptor subunit n=1 Tax=Terriglobus tenax TaxID=1111115 RepID=UPI0021DFA963|nr:efflux RND transporter periplasmic adaptor subunit [Terriglobus tenax]
MSAKKIVITLSVVLVVAIIVIASIMKSRSGVTPVATAKVKREELVSIVSGTGQIKPKTYVNVGATAFGRITHLYVKEGDHVKKGQTLAAIESVQPESAVAAQTANISAAKTDYASSQAAIRTAEANLEQAKADLTQKRFDYERYVQLYREKLVSKQDYDAKKGAFDVAVATLAQREASVNQSKAQADSSASKIQQAVANQKANFDTLDKTVARAPFDALVTNVPVREGETMVTGIQNALGSTLMSLADMSVITAEVKVDETDIVNLKLDQPVNVTVDALPGKSFRGHVTEVGDQALLRTTGIATSQSTTGTEEAKDFKVVVTLDEVSPELKPGLSCTAKITTAKIADALSLPIQALVQRDPVIENIYATTKKTTEAATKAAEIKANPVQGVYVVENKDGKPTVRFVPVATGVTGTTEIQVLSGLTQGQEIVIGRFKVLRTLKSGMKVKRDNTPETATETSS